MTLGFLDMNSQTCYEDMGSEVKTVRDNKIQIIRFQRVKSTCGDDTLLSVESKAKACKEENLCGTQRNLPKNNVLIYKELIADKLRCGLN